MTQLKSLAARGIAVQRSFYSNQEPVITHGIIELRNSGVASATLSIAEVKCLVGTDVITIEDFFLYLLPDYEETEPGHVELPSGATRQYEISFPRLSAVPYLPEDIEIEVTLEFGEDRIRVRSPYRISRRTLKRG